MGPPLAGVIGRVCHLSQPVQDSRRLVVRLLPKWALHSVSTWAMTPAPPGDDSDAPVGDP